MLGMVGGEIVQFERGFFGQTGLNPDLAVRVRIAAAHGTAFVFEDLHVSVLSHRRVIFVVAAAVVDSIRTVVVRRCTWDSEIRLDQSCKR